MVVPNEGLSTGQPTAQDWTTLWSADTCRVQCLGRGDLADTGGSTDVVALVGEIDLEHADAIVHVLLARVAARPTRIEIDLSRLEFIDSFGISRLIMTQQAATDAGVQVTVRGVRPSTRRVLAVAGLITFLNVSEGP
jgi:anti-sigma B factor antagonist